MGTDEAAGAGVAAVDGAGRGRGTRGGVLARRAAGRGAPSGPKPWSTAGGALPAAVAVLQRVRVERRSERGFAVGGAGVPGEAGADTVRPVVSTESVPCVWNSLKKESAGRRSSRQPGLLRSPYRPRWVRLKPKRKRCRLQAKPARGRDSNQRGRRRQKHERRNSSKEQKARQSYLYTWLVCAKIAKIGGG